MNIRIGSFEVEVSLSRRSLYIRVPRIGAMFAAPGWGLVYDNWEEARKG